MVRDYDAGLLIGDPALEGDPASHAVTKIDLGAEWKALTGLPFVYAMWVGRPDAATPAQCRALTQARDAGVAHLPKIAKQVASGNARQEQRVLSYLRDNLKYGLGKTEQAGLRRFHALAAEIGIVPGVEPLRFYGR